MSGGIAFVLDEHGEFSRRCNRDMVDLSSIDDPREALHAKRLIEAHALWTGSAVARRLLDDWSGALARLVLVMPREYRRARAAEALTRIDQLGA